MKEVYERLRERLDDLSTGYPATQSRVEIRILERLFTEEKEPAAALKGQNQEETDIHIPQCYLGNH